MRKKEEPGAWFAEASATIRFPRGDVRCLLCPCLETYSRHQCRLTGEYLTTTHEVGHECPLKFTENQEDKNNESI